jgi:hypothetical protein
MLESGVHQCRCPVCEHPRGHPDKEPHRNMNLLLSHLDGQQQRLFPPV